MHLTYGAGYGYGVSSDYLGEGKLDLPELLEVPTCEETGWAVEFVAGRAWK